MGGGELVSLCFLLGLQDAQTLKSALFDKRQHLPLLRDCEIRYSSCQWISTSRYVAGRGNLFDDDSRQDTGLLSHHSFVSSID